MTPELWQEVKAAFDEISDRSLDDRIAILEGLSDSVRRELEPMLATHDRLLTSTSTGNSLLPEPSLLAALIRDEHTFEEGQILLGRFEIRRFLGSGGMGEVYEALDRILGDVAVKTLRIELAGVRPTIERFRREVMRGRQIAHPNVCRIYDLFETEGDETAGIPFFTMELLSGTTLAAAMRRRGPFPPSDALAIGLQLCAGLQAVHDAGIIHGDFKSGNVILKDGSKDQPFVKITDFGLARMVPWAKEPDVLTAGPIAGTRPYLAPEVLAGSAPSISSDIFAMGVVLFFMRTGRYPFASESDPQDQEERRNPPSRQDLHDELGQNWANAISSCLAWDPDQRPESVAHVSGILLGDYHGISRRQILLGVGVAGVTAIGLETVRRYSWLRSPIPKGVLRTLVEEFYTTGAPPAVGRAARNLFRLALQSSGRLSLIATAEIRQAVEGLGLSTQPLRGSASTLVAQRVGAKLLISGEVRATDGRYRISCLAIDPSKGKPLLPRLELATDFGGLPSAAMRLAGTMRKQLGDEAYVAAQVGGAPLEQADTNQPDALETFTLGLSYFHMGESEPAIAYMKEATRLDPEFGVAYLFQAVIHSAYRREDLALAPVLKAYQLRNKLTPRHRYHLDYLYFVLVGDFDRANQQLRLLVQLFPDDATYHRSYVHSCALLGKPEVGLDSARKIIQLDPNQVMNQNVFISALSESGQVQEGDGFLRDALKRTPDAPALLFCQAYVHLLKLEIDDALRILEQLAKRSAPAALSRAQMIKAKMLGGRLSEARREIERDLPVKDFSGEQEIAGVYRYWLGQVAEVLGDRAASGRCAEELARSDAVPSNLRALRSAAELGWLAGSGEVLDTVTTKLRRIQSAYPSTRSQSFVYFTSALQSAHKSDAGRAQQMMSQAYAFWPDLTTAWALGELLFRSSNYPEALEMFQKAAAARVSAIRFDAVNLWVRSLARVALCMEKSGDVSGAAAYWTQFQKLWGSPSQYEFAR